MNIKTFKAAFPCTIPVLLAYLPAGAAFGVLLSAIGLGPEYALLMSVTIFAGAGQYVAVNLLASPFDPISSMVITFMVNARHIFYGLSLIEKFKGAGKKKLFMIFALTDEAYAIISGQKFPEGIDSKSFITCMQIMIYTYWITGCVLGDLVGTLIPFDSTGIDFAMTALFIVMFIGQWESIKNHLPAISGLVISLICLLIFGADNFLVPALLLIILALAAGKKYMLSEEDAEKTEDTRNIDILGTDDRKECE